ncbi:hypothetical protein EGR_09548 [Echinococcus granulosus]|uniref:Uncharacterized protein n=1 Tax=Echinococcus granulosus TaxID=6210 RepID=W6U3A6_ECHGR|nr:hypothetical protein EGR_09548 [Echinococcus granulosus]EUB55608.1 hypothetical protein EGR_09548 [Echinococcus granulosus]
MSSTSCKFAVAEDHKKTHVSTSKRYGRLAVKMRN